MGCCGCRHGDVVGSQHHKCYNSHAAAATLWTRHAPLWHMSAARATVGGVQRVVVGVVGAAGVLWLQAWRCRRQPTPQSNATIHTPSLPRCGHVMRRCGTCQRRGRQSAACGGSWQVCCWCPKAGAKIAQRQLAIRTFRLAVAVYFRACRSTAGFIVLVLVSVFNLACSGDLQR